jgi:chromosome segregation ATPase
MPKKPIADHFAEWMKRIEEAQQQIRQKMDEMDGEDLKERLSDLESNYEDLDSRHEELSEKVEDHEGQLTDAETRIDDLESGVR